MAETLTDAIANAVVSRIKGTLFPAVTFDGVTGLRTTAALGTVEAKTAMAQPVQTTFKESTNRRSWQRERASWDWLAIVHFSEPADVIDCSLQFALDGCNFLHINAGNRILNDTCHCCDSWCH